MGPSAFATLLASTALLINLPVHAGNWDFLEGTAISSFNETDMAFFQKAVASSLTNRSDGNPIEWSNTDTGAAGSVVAVESKQIDSKPCRLVRIQNRTASIEGKPDRIWLCQDADKEWRIHSLAK